MQSPHPQKDNGKSIPPASTAALEVEALLDGRYALKRLLAQGGGARVLAAEHLFTRRAVAIKVPLGTDSVVLKRFEREMEALARARGHGVVEMLDAGRVGGTPYIVLDLLEGRTLAGLLAARGRLGISETLVVGTELATILGRCHGQGIVHRDVKPANLFLPRTGRPRVVLLDFGIAQLAAEDGAALEKLTREHSLLGTPEYLPPEGLLSGPTDLRADVYSLGVTLYECLTGSVPYEGNYAELLQKLSSTPPRSPREIRDDVPAGLSDAVMRCIARDPARRFQSMAELCAALEASAPQALEPVNLLAQVPREVAADPNKDTLADAPKPLIAATGAGRRRHPRAPYITLARLTRKSGERVDGRLEEISEGGLQFVGDCAIPSGESAALRFALPASGRIAEVQATARWNRTLRGTNATGFEFTLIADNARDEIRKYAAYVGTEPGPAE